MEWIFDDGGRAAAGYRGKTNDCVIRAIAIATGKPYAEVYAALDQTRDSMRQTKQVRTSGARSGIARTVYERYLTALDWRFVPTMGIGTGCRVHLDAAELPAGRIICRLSKHLVAVVDGVIHDTHNCAERGTTIYPPNYLGNIPVGAYWLENGNGWAYCPKRCVYGYYRRD